MIVIKYQESIQTRSHQTASCCENSKSVQIKENVIDFAVGRPILCETINHSEHVANVSLELCGNKTTLDKLELFIHNFSRRIIDDTLNYFQFDIEVGF